MRKGNWIQTYTGMKFYPLDPMPEEIFLIDIAHALALTCRYNGHCNVFYSVAEHCVRMATEVSLPGTKGWRLFHDAAEAYLCDLPRPIKQNFPEYKMAENILLEIIGTKFGLGAIDKKAIEQADLIMLATEHRDIIADGPCWNMRLTEPMTEIIVPWPWQYAELEFLETAKIVLKAPKQ